MLPIGHYSALCRYIDIITMIFTRQVKKRIVINKIIFAHTFTYTPTHIICKCILRNLATSWQREYKKTNELHKTALLTITTTTSFLLRFYISTNISCVARDLQFVMLLLLGGFPLCVFASRFLTSFILYVHIQNITRTLLFFTLVETVV